MKLFPPVRSLCLLALLLSGCQSGSFPNLPLRVGALSFDLNSPRYVARAGETLESIAFRYNITEARLLELNPSAASGVYTGMELFIRPPSTSNQASIIREAAYASPGVDVARNSVQVSPTVNQQAVPLVVVDESDEFLLSGETINLRSSQRPEILREPVPDYIEELGFPVEEVIEDDDFVLPGTEFVSENTLVGGEAYETGWEWPLRGQLARDYDPGRPNGRGIEIVGFPGDKVRATRDGVVNWVARSPDGVGKVVIIRHKDDYLSIYSNTDDLFVSMDDTVKAGDAIASLGANANDEPLLRFEISRDGKLLNPMDFLSAR